ncbi:MAG: hypothetical protein MJ236_05165, partial [Clostridia bacterium]|nr:hypothetical protein [Clostridia bacterium]
DGKGTIKISASDEDDLIYSDSILGYVPVTEIDSSALSFSLENETFTELSWGGIRDICNINFELINFKLNENRNGFIYLEIVNESDKEPYSLKRLVPIVNGVGSLEYDGTIADGSKEMKLSVNPICFVKNQEFNDGDVVVEKELEIEKDEYSFGTFFNGNAKYTMPTIDSGFVCYSKTLISGGYSNMRGVKEYSWDTIFKHELEVYVSSYTVDVEGYEAPKYDLEMIGYVPFIKVQIRKG